jgi:GntR family transcriptional regulator
MLEIDADSAVPINDQIKAGLRGLVSRGLLRPGDQAPSIRSLAGSLKVNPNTVARAYRELTLEGVLETRRGDGNYVSSSAARKAEKGLEEARASLCDAVRRARGAGLSWKDIEEAAARAKKEEK